MTQILQLWGCMANRDTTEGRGPSFVVCYTETKEQATKIVKDPAFYGRYGVMGCDNCHVDSVTIIIVKSIDDFKNHLASNDKEKALAKLTDYEKKILGLI